LEKACRLLDISKIPTKSSQKARPTEISQTLFPSTPIPEPIPVVFDQWVIGIILRHFQVSQRKLDHLLPLASFADNAKRFTISVKAGIASTSC
jgi:hypothetical protein